MKTPVPRIDETPAELKRLLDAEADAQKHHRLQALYLLQTRQALRERLAQPEGFASYKAIWQWLQHDYGLSIAYKTVHRLVRYQLRAKLKVPRKSPIKKR